MTDPLLSEAVAALSRGHALFAGDVTDSDGGGTPGRLRAHADALDAAATTSVAASSRTAAQGLRRLVETDRSMAQTVAVARAHHAHARAATRRLLDSARADGTPGADTPIGRREAAARMVARLLAQHRHIMRSHAQSRLLARRLRRLHYLHRHPHRHCVRGTGRAEILAAIHKALNIKGIHDPVARARWERGMDLVARRESNYDAGAVNRWDSNAANGIPSKGAWQFIAPTFAAYHEPGTSTNIHDLVAQACAFINYARGRYGVAADASDLADRIQQADPRRAPRGY